MTVKTVNCHTFGYLFTRFGEYRLLAPFPCDTYNTGDSVWYVCNISGGVPYMLVVRGEYDIRLLNLDETVPCTFIEDSAEEAEKPRIKLNGMSTNVMKTLANDATGNVPTKN